jgi:hypothetical protein
MPKDTRYSSDHYNSPNYRSALSFSHRNPEAYILDIMQICSVKGVV